jgi:hypothetical protein
MLIKEHKTRTLPSMTGTIRLSRTWTMDECIYTGKITNKRLERVRIEWTQ